MKRETVDKYRKYMTSLMDFFNKKYKIKPYPKIKLNTEKQKDDVFGKTGYYDPSTKTIVIYINARFFKDVLRSFSHELVHHYQNLENRLQQGDYHGDQIVDDDKLMKLEEEAYLKGNIVFRSWTETILKEKDNEIVDKPTEHMRKLIKLNENMIEEIIKLK